MVTRNAVAQNSNGKIATTTAAEADVLIEELMEEAKLDPSFGVMPGLSRPESLAGRGEGGCPQESRPGSAATATPFVPRPHRTGQDFIIRDRSEERGQAGEAGQVVQQEHALPTRPYRTATDFKIQDRTDAASRSRSADGRGRKPFKQQDPKLTNFKRTPSCENFTGEMMAEVVTDKEHRSVKDLVANLEKSTKAESENAYIRKWGCDLISPEPRRKNVTARYQRRQMPDPEFASRLQHSAGYSDYGSRSSSRARNLSGGSREGEQEFLQPYTTDLEELIDRQHGEQDIGLVCGEEQQVGPAKVVVWPPASPTPVVPSQDTVHQQQQQLREQQLQEQQLQQQQLHEQYLQHQQLQEQQLQEQQIQIQQQLEQQQQSAVKNYIVSESENIVKKRKSKKSSKVAEMNQRNLDQSNGLTATNGSQYKYDRNSLRELDAQIMDIQSQFESELESLIGWLQRVPKGKPLMLLNPTEWLPDYSIHPTLAILRVCFIPRRV